MYPDTPVRGEGYDFEAYAGELGNTESVYRFFDYYRVEPAEPDYCYAWVIRTEETASLGEGAAILALCGGMRALELEHLPIVDIYFLAESSDELGKSTLSVPFSASPDEVRDRLRLGGRAEERNHGLGFAPRR